MGKLHKIRKAITNHPERFHNGGVNVCVYKRVKLNNNKFGPYVSINWMGKSYAAYVRHILKELYKTQGQ